MEKYFYVPPPDDPVSFLLIARLIWDKGIGEYVEAARLLRPIYPKVKFKLLGPFDSNPAAISPGQINRWVKEGVVEYLGETDDVRPHLAETSIYVLPSAYREGTPRSDVYKRQHYACTNLLLVSSSFCLSLSCSTPVGR